MVIYMNEFEKQDELNEVPVPAENNPEKTTSAENTAGVSSLYAKPVPKEPTVFRVKDWIALAFAIVLAFLWLRIFGFSNLLEFGLPYFGVTFFTLALFAAVFIYLGKKAVLNASSIFLTAGAVLLSVCFTLYQCDDLWFLNICLLFAATPIAIFALSGRAEREWTDVSVLWNTVGLTFRAIFVNFPKPFSAIGGLFRGGSKKKIAGVFVGLLCAIPLLAIVLSLLSSADAVFAGLFENLFSAFDNINLGSIIKTGLASLMIFSFLYFLTQPAKEKKERGKTEKNISSVPFFTVLILLDAIYIIFVVIQFAFLFGGAETAAMEGGYAEYARNGFFQLVTVSAINLCAILTVTSCLKKNTHIFVKVLSFVLVFLTAVILFSAFWRMRLYILAYGLSLLRAMTLFGMLFIAICLGAASYKIYKPDFKFWQVFFAVGMAGWIIFNFCNPCAVVAEYNVNSYLSGNLTEVDIYYLADMSPSSLPALQKLRDQVGGDYRLYDYFYNFYYDDDLDDCIEKLQKSSPGLREWSLDAFIAKR